jgi:hypothetical protein
MSRALHRTDREISAASGQRRAPRRHPGDCSQAPRAAPMQWPVSPWFAHHHQADFSTGLSRRPARCACCGSEILRLSPVARREIELRRNLQRGELARTPGQTHGDGTTFDRPMPVDKPQVLQQHSAID